MYRYREGAFLKLGTPENSLAHLLRAQYVRVTNRRLFLLHRNITYMYNFGYFRGTLFVLFRKQTMKTSAPLPQRAPPN